MANWSVKDLTNQYNRAKRLGWLPHVADAASAFGHTPWDLLAVGSRESNLDPKYLRITGDHGNGFGPWQVDKRYFPEWTRTDAWKDPREAVFKGADILARKRQEILDTKGKRQTVTSRSGSKATFTGKPFTHEQLRLISFAAYNSGMWAYYHFSQSGNPDRGTTGKDYSADVNQRSKVFRRLWEADQPSATSPPASPQVADAAPPADSPSGGQPVAAAPPVEPVAPVAAEPVAVAKVTSGSGSWARSVSAWIGTLAASASGYVRDAFNLSPEIQRLLLVGVVVLGVVWLFCKLRAESQVRDIASKPELNNVK